MTTALETRFARLRGDVETALDGLLGEAPSAGEIARPERLTAAMRHAALGGGKRLRPLLLVEAARVCGYEDPGVLRAGAALECVHCYSLVHDDLPAMDDDDTRRGKPTVHKAYDEATAILAGDALLTLAFDILARPATHPDGAVRAELVAALARAAGLGGMAGGQMLDLQAENQALGEDDIATLHAMKTGALFRYACEAGAILAEAPTDQREALIAFGEAYGRAFQLADDLLDATASAEEAGKRTAKDAERGKATYVALHGVEAARQRLAAAVEQSTALLARFGSRGEPLAAIAQKLTPSR